MNNQPLLSIIVPVYGTEEFLPKCLDSILESSYKNKEIIVVDDCSPGNIGEIMEHYLNTYENIKLVHHDTNKGLYLARISGIEHSTGEFIAFLDSDDHVSCDFYRRLINQAIVTQSDLVMGEYRLEYPDGKIIYQNLVHSRVMDIDLKEREIEQLLFDQEGADYSLWVVWNKIYHRSIWDKALPYLKKQTRHLIMCEDILYSSILFFFAEHMTNVHGDFIYYLKNGESSTGLSKPTFSKYERNIKDLIYVFDFISEFYEVQNCSKDILDKLDCWLGLLRNIWYRNVNESSLSDLDKKKLINILTDKHNKKLVYPSREKDDFYHLHYTYTNCNDEEAKLSIIDPAIDVVSFDIFDTLLVRPFFEPTDLFEILSNHVAEYLDLHDKIDFKQLRIDAERIARDKQWQKNSMVEDITLDDIYSSLAEISVISKIDLDWIKKKELELELELCQERNFAKQLFELALYCGKRVIITSDMYLPREQLEAMLTKLGYIGYERLYISCETQLTKSSGNLFKHIVGDLSVQPDRILHVGDTWHSDIENADKNGFKVLFLPKTVDLLKGWQSNIYSGEVFKNIFESSYRYRNTHFYQRFIGLRCSLAVVANQLFDNPFIEYMPDSDFNADPRVIGYYALGMHMFAVAKWLHDEVKLNKYDSLNFMARDGYLPLKAFEILNRFQTVSCNTNYVGFSRNSILPFQLQKEEDLDKLISNFNIFTITPKEFLSKFSGFMKSPTYEAIELCNAYGFKPEQTFNSKEVWYKFVQFFKTNLWDEEKLYLHREKLKAPITNLFKGKSATFDVGYSCRVESALKRAYNLDITPYYIHINNDIANFRAQQAGLQFKTFFEHSPGVTGVLRELLLSGLEPSYSKIDIDDKGQLVYEFKPYIINYKEHYIINIIQTYALKFVEDMNTIFKDDIKFLYYQREDMSLVHEYLNHSPKYQDKMVFSMIEFEDDLTLGKMVNMVQFWDNQLRDIYQSSSGVNNFSHSYIYWIKPLWKRAIYLYFLDRNFLKMKIKEKFKYRPLLLLVMTKSYKLLRSIYRTFKK